MAIIWHMCMHIHVYDLPHIFAYKWTGQYARIHMNLLKLLLAGLKCHFQNIKFAVAGAKGKVKIIFA